MSRPDDATSSGTVRDAASWVERWLAIDDSLHVYWLLPPRERADYDGADVHADRDRVTLIDPIPVDELLSRTAEYADGRPITDREDVAFVDVIYALRSLGYEDAGNPGTLAFRNVPGQEP